MHVNAEVKVTRPMHCSLLFCALLLHCILMPLPKKDPLHWTGSPNDHWVVIISLTVHCILPWNDPSALDLGPKWLGSGLAGYYTFLVAIMTGFILYILISVFFYLCFCACLSLLCFLCVCILLISLYLLETESWNKGVSQLRLSSLLRLADHVWGNFLCLCSNFL